MPITSDRMVALIAAALDYEQAIEALIRRINDQRKLARAGAISWQDALEYCNSTADLLVMLQRPSITPKTVAVEAQHFRTNAARLRSARKWAARKRAEDRGEVFDEQSYNEGHAPRTSSRNAQIFHEQMTRDPIHKPRVPAERRPGLSEDDKASILREVDRYIASQDSDIEADALTAVHVPQGDSTDIPPGSYQPPAGAKPAEPQS